MPPDLRPLLLKHWGFDTLRPLQGESIEATLRGRDSLTVLPTGGGKSLCYQLPPLVTERLTVVVSPLIALMQDQVAALGMAGVPAAALHSHLDRDERIDIKSRLKGGELRLLFVAPERLLTPDLLADLARLHDTGRLGHLAIDEAHCISQWGHDFRPEYRRLSELRDALPGVPLGAYTATATPRVREDIARQLRLTDHAELVGSFDRTNLTYRILPRVDLTDQVAEALERHPTDAAIVYCITRKDTEQLAESLAARGVDAEAYHAGMTPVQRARVGDRFRTERLRVVVATVAFGMGIDRGDVRLVVHAAMPKSIEHYQQETGRAGRDGLPAECLLLYSAADPQRWRQVIDRGAAEADPPADPEAVRAQFELLDHMHRLAAGARCRHRALAEYFGQTLEHGPGGCGACDLCLGELHPVDDAHEVARKILSCVYRCQQRFGAAHVADVLLGKPTPKIRELGHTGLSTFGLLRTLTKPSLTSYINQLIDAGHLARTPGDYPVLQLTTSSAAVLKNEVRASLVEPKVAARAARAAAPATRTRVAPGLGAGQRFVPESALAAEEPAPALSPAEEALFQHLRAWRRELATQRAVPPYVILGDATLTELCQVRPSTTAVLATVKGIGKVKLEDLGPALVETIGAYCREHGLSVDTRHGRRRG